MAWSIEFFLPVLETRSLNSKVVAGLVSCEASPVLGLQMVVFSLCPQVVFVCVCVRTRAHIPVSLSVSKFPLLIRHRSYCTGGVLSGSMVKNLPAMQETQGWSLDWEDPLRRTCQPTPIFLPRESHGQQSLVGYSPWGLKESDMTEMTEHAHTQAHILD